MIASRVSIPATALAALPDMHFAFVMRAARAANDILVTQRAAIAYQNGFESSSDHDEKNVQLVLWADVLTHLAARSWEAWDIVQTSARLWQPSQGIDLTQEARVRLDALKAEYSNGSSLKTIRNEVAFHYDRALLLEQQRTLVREAADQGQELIVFAGERHMNTFFAFATQMAIFAMLDRAFPQIDRQSQMNKFAEVTTDAASNLQTFFAEVITAVLAQADVPTELADMQPTGRASLDALRMPFFLTHE